MATRSKMLKDTRIHLLKRTVMIVDDEAEFREEARTVLGGQGFELICLESANHALRYMQNQAWNWYPWLLITDLVMDGMGGYQLMRRVTEIYPNRTVPMIVVSKLGSPDDISEAEQAGASVYLRKPLNGEELMAAIKQATGKKEKNLEIKFVDKEI